MQASNLKIDADYNTPAEPQLHIVSRLRGGMQIFAKSLTGNTILVDVEASYTIDNVKAKSQENLDHPRIGGAVW